MRPMVILNDGYGRGTEDGSMIVLLHNINLNDRVKRRKSVQNKKYSKTCILFAIRH